MVSIFWHLVAELNSVDSFGLMHWEILKMHKWALHSPAAFVVVLVILVSIE